MLYQEVALWEAKRVKEKSKYMAGPVGIKAMVDLIDKQVWHYIDADISK